MSIKLLGKVFNSIDEACNALGVEYTEVVEEAKRQGVNTQLALNLIIEARKNNIDKYMLEQDFTRELKTEGVIHATSIKSKKVINDKETDDYISEHEYNVREIKVNRMMLAYLKEALRMCSEYNDNYVIIKLIRELEEEIVAIKSSINLYTEILKSNGEYNADELKGPISDKHSIDMIRCHVDAWDERLSSAFNDARAYPGMHYIPDNCNKSLSVSRRIDKIIAKQLERFSDEDIFWGIWNRRLNSIKANLKLKEAEQELKEHGIVVLKLDDIISGFKKHINKVLKEEKTQRENGTYNINSPNFYYNNAYDTEFSYAKLVKYIKEICVQVDGIYWTDLDSGLNGLGIKKFKQIGTREYTGTEFFTEKQISSRNLLKQSLFERDEGLKKLEHLLRKGNDSRWALKEVLGDLFNKIEDSYDQADLCKLLFIPKNKVQELVNQMAHDKIKAGNNNINYDRLWDRAITIVWQSNDMNKRRG